MHGAQCHLAAFAALSALAVFVLGMGSQSVLEVSLRRKQRKLSTDLVEITSRSKAARRLPMLYHLFPLTSFRTWKKNWSSCATR